MLHFIAEQTFLRIMVGLQYYVNCVWSICVCVCSRYTYKKHLADGIYYVIALEPGSRSGIIGDERSNSGATNPWFPSYIHIYVCIYIHTPIYDLHDPMTILPRALCSKIPIHVGPVYNRYFFPILIFIFFFGRRRTLTTLIVPQILLMVLKRITSISKTVRRTRLEPTVVNIVYLPVIYS